MTREHLLQVLGINTEDDLTEEAKAFLAPYMGDEVFVTPPDSRFPAAENQLCPISGWQSDYGKLALRTLKPNAS